MPDERLPGGPTQDEILAVAIRKLGLTSVDTVLEIGCGTGTVTAAMAERAGKIFAIDRRPEAIDAAMEFALNAGVKNISFSCAEAAEFLRGGRDFDCAFVGGSAGLRTFLPVLASRVKRTIVINAVLLSTVSDAVAILQELGLFTEVVQVQVARSHALAGSLMFKPIDPVWIIVGRGAACS